MQDLVRGPLGDVLPVQGNDAVVDPSQAQQYIAQLALAIARDAGNAQDLAGIEVKANIAQPDAGILVVQHDMAKTQQRLSRERGCVLALGRPRRVAAQHEADALVLGCFFTQHRDAVCSGHQPRAACG